LVTDIIVFLKENKPLLTLLTPFAITVFLLPRLAKLASKIGLIDRPGRRKIHLKAKPLIGGLAMSLAVALTGLLFIPLFNLRGFYAGLVLLVITGFLDDFGELNHRYKFVAQITAAVFIMYFSKVYLHTFGDLLSIGTIDFHFSAPIITIIGTVGVCNAINMIDGLDGLAGGICLTAFATFAYLAFIDNHTSLMLLSLAICGALSAFLIYNWHPSKLFMGDAGSLFLGFTAAFVSIALTQEPGSLIRPVSPLLVLTVPIVDTLTVMTKRLMKGKNPFHADKGHLHHILLKLGFSNRQTASIIILLSALFSSIAIAGDVLKIPEYYLFLFFMAYFAAYFTASFYVRKLIRNRKKLLILFNPSFLQRKHE
jgi:UDP-GlcNAc:undecaprenyl-phosphate GlcNAc-1-phosphate transferase